MESLLESAKFQLASTAEKVKSSVIKHWLQSGEISGDKNQNCEEKVQTESSLIVKKEVDIE